MARRMTILLGLVVFSFFLSGCKLFGPSKAENISIPPGTSDVLGFVLYIDDFPGEDLDVELAGQTVTTQESGAFSFVDVDNGIYTLKVRKNSSVIGEERVVLKDDISNLVVMIGESVFQNTSFEDPIPDPFPPSNTRVGWGANPNLDGSWEKDAEITVDSTVSRTGSRSVKVYGERGDMGGSPRSTLRQYGDGLVSGATYRLTSWFKTDREVTHPEENPIYMRLRFYKTGSTSNIVSIADGFEEMMLVPEAPYYDRMNNFALVYPEGHDDEWNRLYVEFVLPEDSDRILMELTYGMIWHDGDEATLWWDDVTLVRID